MVSGLRGWRIFVETVGSRPQMRQEDIKITPGIRLCPTGDPGAVEVPLPDGSSLRVEAVVVPLDIPFLLVRDLLKGFQHLIDFNEGVFRDVPSQCALPHLPGRSRVRLPWCHIPYTVDGGQITDHSISMLHRSASPLSYFLKRARSLEPSPSVLHVLSNISDRCVT